MGSRVYETVGCLSSRPSVCPIIRPQQRATGLLLSAVRAGDIDRQLRAPGGRQQRRRSTALSSKCGQCHVSSRVDEAEHRLRFTAYFCATFAKNK